MKEEEEEIIEGQETETQKNDKVTKKYNNIMRVVTAVVGGEKNLKLPSTVGQTTTAKLVAELFQEEEEALEKETKEGLRELLKLHLSTQRAIAAKKKELDSLDLQKKKEFTEAANKWVNKIQQSEIMSQEYAEALNIAFNDVEIDREVVRKTPLKENVVVKTEDTDQK